MKPWEIHFINWNLVIVQAQCHFWLFLTPWVQHTRPLSLTITQGFPEMMSIKWVKLYNHLLLSHPYLLLIWLLPKNQGLLLIRVSSLLRWSKLWGLSFSISDSNASSELICLMFGWLDLLAIQWTHTSLPQQSSLVFSYLYMSTGKTIYVTLCACIGQVISSLFNMLSKFVRVFFQEAIAF